MKLTASALKQLIREVMEEEKKVPIASAARAAAQGFGAAISGEPVRSRPVAQKRKESPEECMRRQGHGLGCGGKIGGVLQRGAGLGRKMIEEEDLEEARKKKKAKKRKTKKKKAKKRKTKKKKKDKDWIQKAVDPKHKGYCTPMTKKTCTPRRKALAMRFKKAARKEKREGGTGWQGKV